MSKRNHDEFLDRNPEEIAEEMAMDGLIRQTINRIKRETALLTRQRRIAALYKKRTLLREEYELVKEEANSAEVKLELLKGEYMSCKDGNNNSDAQLATEAEKLASWSEATDDYAHKVSLWDAKDKELKSVLKEIKSLKEEDTESQTSDDAQELSANNHD